MSRKITFIICIARSHKEAQSHDIVEIFVGETCRSYYRLVAAIGDGT